MFAGLFTIHLVNEIILTLVCFALVSLSAISVSTSWQHEIIVDWKKGNDSRSCLEEGSSSPCATVNMALKGLKQDSTVIHIKPGTYILELGQETNITNRYMVAIIGSGKEDTVIKCASSVGLWFISSKDVTIQSLTFQECGHNVFYTKHTVGCYTLSFQVAICLMSCHSIILKNVNVHSSNGTGLLIIDATGNMTLYNSSVTESRANPSLGHLKPKQTFITGGGIISFSFYKSMDYLNITESHIVSNHMKIFQSVFSLYCDETDGVTFDLAGGIALFYFSSPGHVLIDSCSILNNTRGLVLFDLSTNAIGVTVNISNTQYFNHQESTIIVVNEYGEYYGLLSSLQLFNLITTDQLVIYSDSKKKYSYKELKKGYALSFSSLYLAVKSSDDVENNLPSFQFEKESNCYYMYDFEIDSECSAECHLPYYLNYYDTDSDFNCSDHREGTLCSKCEDGYSVAINSLSLSCVSCDEATIAQGWTALTALEFFPLTVMVIVIAIVNVNLNQGSLNAFILFCQISAPFSVSFFIGSFFFQCPDKDAELLNLFFYSLNIWNLDFINFLGESTLSKGYYSICISHSTTPLGAISFWYLIAFYPLLLLIVFYVCIVLYEKGYRCVVLFIRPVHRVLARFWQMFKIQPSLTHTVASVYTLCSTLLTTVSFKILFPIQHKGKNYFFYDGTQRYFEDLHGLACTFALIVLLIQIIVTIYLSLYPFQFFQKFFSKLKFKKDFLVAVTDVFTGPYKDGTNNSWDYRYFAGIHFALRLFILPFNYLPALWVAFILQICVYSIIILTLVIFRPYKRNIHTFNEVVLVFSLCVVSWTGSITAVPASIISFIICIVVIPYCLVWIYKKCTLGIRNMNYFKPKPSSIPNVHQSTKRLNVNIDYDYSFTDRLMNPENHDEHHTSTLTGAMDIPTD